MIRKFILLPVFMAFCLVAMAQDPIEGVIQTILTNNAALQAQQQTISADRMALADENALANPGVDFARVWGRHGIGNKLQLDISQEFDWPGVYRVRSNAADMAQAVAESEYMTAQMELAVEARELLLELVFVRKQIAVITDLRNNFGKLGDAIDKGVRGGELTVLDQRKMQIENYEIDNQLAEANARIMEIESSLQALSTVTLDLSGIDSYPIQQLLDLQTYIDQVQQDPAVTAQMLSADYEQLNAKVAGQSRMPGFKVGYQHQAEMGDRFNGFTVGMTLPVFEGRKARQAALERKDAAEMQRDDIIVKRTAEVKGTYSRLELYRSRIDAYNRTFGDNKYLALLLKAYDGGQITVVDYLSEIHYYHQTMLTYLESEYNYNVALASLNRYK